jgi:type IV pilus assembly protein PilC
MMKAGVPLLQAFDIVGRGSHQPAHDQAAQRHPQRRRDRHQPVVGLPQAPDALRRAVLQPGRSRRGGRHPGSLLDRLAIYQEKTLAIKSKIKSALMYPIAVIVVAFVVLTVIMIFVIPAFKEVFKSFGADLPAPDAGGDRHVEVLRQAWWWAIFGLIGGGGTSSSRAGSARRRCRCSWTGCC